MLGLITERLRGVNCSPDWDLGHIHQRASSCHQDFPGQTAGAGGFGGEQSQRGKALPGQGSLTAQGPPNRAPQREPSQTEPSSNTFQNRVHPKQSPSKHLPKQSPPQTEPSQNLPKQSPPNTFPNRAFPNTFSNTFPNRAPQTPPQTEPSSNRAHPKNSLPKHLS